MAIKKESLQKLLVRLKIAEDDAKAKELIDAQEEKDIAVPDTLKIYTVDEFTTATANLKNEGIKIGKEIGIKELKEKAGLDFEGKDPEKFITEFKASVQKESNISVDDKVKDRDKTINELKAALKKEQDEKTDALKTKDQIVNDTNLLRKLPKDRDDRFEDDHWLNVVKSELQVSIEDGKEIVKDRQGNVIKDAQFNPVSYETAVSDLFKTKKWIKAQEQQKPKGPGFDDSTKVPGAINNMKEFKAYASSQGWDLKGQEAQAKLAEVTKGNANFVFEEN
jgi:hypothetical protein